MSSYEFWDELGKIFNAVVAYQEKNLEFNKRFISPWIRLGNVFEKQDRNKDAINAYERAIEIDGGNPQNWFELGNLHFKMENYPEAVSALNKAIELDPTFGAAYSNLGLTLATRGEVEQAIPLYQKSIELLREPKDTAMAWNRLGNAYRKLNQYEQALEAFHKADELDRDNAGFRDSLDEASDAPTVMQTPETGTGEAEPVSVNPIELIVADSQAAEAQAAETALTAAAEASPANVEASGPEAVQEIAPAAQVNEAVEQPVVEPIAEPATAQVDEPVAAPITEPAAEQVNETVAAPIAEPAAAPGDEAIAAPIAEPVAAQVDEPVAKPADETATAIEAAPAAAVSEAEKSQPEAAAPVEETVTVVVQDATETFTETLAVGETATETSDAALAPLAAEPKIEDVKLEELPPLSTDVITSEDVEPLDEADLLELPPGEGLVVPQMKLEAEDPALTAEAEEELASMADPAPNSLADQLLEAEPGVLDIPQHIAYEEYLKDMNEPIDGLNVEARQEAENPGSPEPAAKIDASGELQIEMDTKNAHVWNELGNVYFNSTAYDDSIVAYSKAIELDRWFAWPYSNLALAYVQKRRFVEAILLYQRSIELFTSDKDKAISWNRLGNVYRRLNDYENAIAAYQRADALDPDNSTLSLQSRFSLLGSYAMDQKASYVS
ncbi:MAG TPA: tetratricopeptide repeat protein [Anaerolineales bacterium]